MTKPTVLIVEDDMLTALETELLLVEAGFVPIGHAPDSREAAALGARLAPDVAVVDLSLRDGPTGTALARYLARELGTLVVFATGNARDLPDDLAGAVGAIEKPYDDGRFAAAMSYVQDLIDGEAGPPPAGLIAAPGRPSRAVAS